MVGLRKPGRDRTGMIAGHDMPRLSSQLARLVKRHSVLLLLVASSGLQGCLTQALWHEAQEAPPLAYQVHAGQVHEVRGQLRHGSLDNQLLISFSTPRLRGTPAHLATYTEAAPGMLRLVPPGRGGGDWQTQPGSRLFQAEGWGFRIYRGDYLTEAGVNALLWFHGRLEPEKVCRLLPAHRVPTRIREQPGLRVPGSAQDLMDRCLVAFANHDWLHLATGRRPQTGYLRAPLAFVDAEGRIVSPDQMRDRVASVDPPAAREFLAGCKLIARLDGRWQGQRNLHVEIPLPVLAQGPRLTLNRVLHKVHWRRTQVWHGEQTQRQPRMHQLARLQLPLDSQVFAYVDAREAPGSTLLPTLARLALTPVAVAADFLWAHSIYFRSLLEALRQGQPRGPTGTRNK